MNCVKFFAQSYYSVSLEFRLLVQLITSGEWKSTKVRRCTNHNLFVNTATVVMVQLRFSVFRSLNEVVFSTMNQVIIQRSLCYCFNCSFEWVIAYKRWSCTDCTNKTFDASASVLFMLNLELALDYHRSLFQRLNFIFQLHYSNFYLTMCTVLKLFYLYSAYLSPLFTSYKCVDSLLTFITTT